MKWLYYLTHLWRILRNLSGGRKAEMTLIIKNTKSNIKYIKEKNSISWIFARFVKCLKFLDSTCELLFLRIFIIFAILEIKFWRNWIFSSCFSRIFTVSLTKGGAQKYNDHSLFNLFKQLILVEQFKYYLRVLDLIAFDQLTGIGAVCNMDLISRNLTCVFSSFFFFSCLRRSFDFIFFRNYLVLLKNILELSQ